MRSYLRRVLLVTVLAAVVGSGGEANAAAFVNRPLTLSRSDWALDFGLGIAHIGRPRITGVGFNLELKAGLTSFIEFGIRSGIRVDTKGRAVQADSFGRMFETDTYNTGGDTFANPEIALRWALVHSNVELGLDGRVYLPTDGGDFGILVGVPVALHLGGVARIDTGVFVPIIFAERETRTLVSIPLELWLQPSSQLYLGPLFGWQFHDPGTTIHFGFGLGYAVSYDIDLKTWLLFPNIRSSGKDFGAGVGLQVRF
jgi:hypothetical protein